jgi:hypothetical protein
MLVTEQSPASKMSSLLPLFCTSLTLLSIQATPFNDCKKAFPLLALPAELRRIIYEYIAPDRYLLATPRADYFSLLYSCTQIRDELIGE